MSLEIKFKCNICGEIKESNKISISYNYEIIKQRIVLANGFVNASIHICKDCAKIIKETIPYEKS